MPRIIRLYVRRPLMCYLLWLAVPVGLLFLVGSRMTLTDPLEGWRIRDHPTAETLDAVTMDRAGAGEQPTGPSPRRRSTCRRRTTADRRHTRGEAA